MLSVVIPVYNEADRLKENINFLESHLKNTGNDFEIVISDDGSTDKTIDVIKGLANKSKRIRFVRSKENKGRGAALKNAACCTNGSNVIFMDADLPLTADMKIIDSMIKYLGEQDIVIGSRFVEGASIKRKFHRMVLSKAYRSIVGVFFGDIGVRDYDVGCKAFNGKVFKEICPNIKSDGWPWDLEFLLVARKNGYKIKEIPLAWIETGRSSVRIWKDPIDKLIGVLRIWQKYKRS